MLTAYKSERKSIPDRVNNSERVKIFGRIESIHGREGRSESEKIPNRERIDRKKEEFVRD